MTQSKTRIVEHVYSPEKAVDSSLRMIRARIEDPKTGITQHIPGADFLKPWHAGELIILVGYTSNGKSSLATYMMTQHAQLLRSYQVEDPDYRHIILYVTWEHTIEEQTVMDLSRVTSIPAAKIFQGELKPDEIEKVWGNAAKDRRSLPIWLIGSSVNDDRRRVRFSMEEINEALIYLETECKLSIDLIALDYLQRIRRTKSQTNELREGFMDVVDKAKDMALRCPVLLLSQAGRQVKSRDWQLPDLDDGQETSNLEQSSDHYYSVWMPKQTRRKTLTVGELKYEITDDLLVIGYLKQKRGPAPIVKVYNMGYGGTYLTEAEGVAAGESEKKRRSVRSP